MAPYIEAKCGYDIARNRWLSILQCGKDRRDSPYFAAGFWFQPGDEANRV